jgi:DNA-binding response OmpR family regulator
MSEALRVMIVDDEQDVREILRPLLEPEYEVVEAVNGLDALLKIPQYEPDVLIIDLMMPLMDGWQLAQRVRKHQDFSQIPMIFLSALDSSEAISRGYALGAAVYITKPFDPERIRRNIEVFVERGMLTPRRKKLAIQTIRRMERDEKNQPPAPTPTTERVVRPVGSPMPPPGSLPPTGHRPTPRPETGEPELQPEPGPFAAEPPPPLPRVLVVDDDPEILDILRIALQAGFEVATAHDGLEASLQIPDLEPDLFIIDIMLPKMSGYQLIQLIRQSRETAKAPIVVLTAKSSERDRQYCLNLGADVFLSKPFRTEYLVNQLHKLSRKPGFHVRTPKKRSYESILEEVGATAEAAEQEEIQRRLKRTHVVVQKFLDRHQREDPFGDRAT